MVKIFYNNLIIFIFFASLFLPCYADNAALNSPIRRQKQKKIYHNSNISLNTQNPQKTLHGLLKNIQDSKTLSPEHKEAISLCLKELSKTQTGRYIFRNIPETIKTRIMPSGSGVLGSYGGKTLSIAEGLFKNILNPKSEPKKRKAMLFLTAVIAHELTHATQHHLKIGFASNAHPEDRATMRKFREMHSLLEQAYATKELLELPFFEEVKKERAKNGELDFFPARAEQLQIKAGMSPEKARRFARTELVRSYWSNTPGTPVKIGNNTLYSSFVGPSLHTSESWNNTYNAYTFKWSGGRNIHNAQKNSIHAELKKILHVIGLDLTPEFIMERKSFRFEQERLIGYLDGIKQSEITSLGTKGTITKYFDNKKLVQIKHNIDETDGEHKGYFQDKTTLKAIYEIKDKKLSGKYREYNRQKQQVMEISFQAGKPHGTGWVLKNRKKTQIEFRNGILIINGKKYTAVKKNSKYWQNRYIKENK